MRYYAWTPDEGTQVVDTEDEARAIVAEWVAGCAPDEPNEPSTRGPEWGVLTPSEVWMVDPADHREWVPQGDMDLAELSPSGRLAGWETLDWDDACECGAEWYAPPEVYDGDRVVCRDCGAVGSVSADEDGASVGGPIGRLTPDALAELLRVRS